MWCLRYRRGIEIWTDCVRRGDMGMFGGFDEEKGYMFVI